MMTKNNLVVAIYKSDLEIVGGLSALGAGLYGMGIPKDSVLKYETAVKIGKYVLIAHGSDAETVHAREIISRTNPEALEAHQPVSSSGRGVNPAGARCS